LEKSIEGNLDSDHAPIGQYLWHPKPLIPKVQMGSRLVVVATSMNHLPSLIEDSSTRWILGNKRPIVQTTTVFVIEHNYERPHIDDNILEIEGWCPTKWIVTKHLGWNIIITLCGIDISEVEEGCNNDDDDNDTNIPNETIEILNDSDYHEPRPQHPNSTISHPP
jgi:hypothetical protein